MPTYKGSIEHLFAVVATISGTIQSMFKVTYDFLNSGSDLGIERLAYNTGTRPTGCGQTGTNFYDQAQPFGDNSWACFRFSSASIPFDILIQYSGTGATFGNTTNDHARIGGSAASTQNNFGISIATAFSGSTPVDPWNGTRTLSGSDRKGTAVWTSGSATNRLTVFPRSNAFGGSYVATNDDMVAFVIGFGTSTPHRFQLVASKDAIYMARDQADDAAYDKFFYAGNYNPVSGSSPIVPLVVWCPLTTNETAGTQIPNGTAGTTNTSDGGIAHPLYNDTKFLSIDRLTYFNQTTALQPNNSFSPTQYDEFPVYVGMNETTASYGICGTLDFVREIYKTNVHDINNVTQRAVLGSTVTVSAIKHSIPWVSGTTPGTGTTRAGVQFSRLHMAVINSNFAGTLGIQHGPRIRELNTNKLVVEFSGSIQYVTVTSPLKTVYKMKAWSNVSNRHIYWVATSSTAGHPVSGSMADTSHVVGHQSLDFAAFDVTPLREN